MSNAVLPFLCSETGCEVATASDWCATHEAPHIEIECDDSDTDDECFACGGDCKEAL